uniref:Uncharacterized protein n=1 Tax=Arundo donax TaxID=35708 RepID=A0A0A9B2X2_ARUDO
MRRRHACGGEAKCHRLAAAVARRPSRRSITISSSNGVVDSMMVRVAPPPPPPLGATRRGGRGGEGSWWASGPPALRIHPRRRTHARGRRKQVHLHRFGDCSKKLAYQGNLFPMPELSTDQHGLHCSLNAVESPCCRRCATINKEEAWSTVIYVDRIYL